MREVGVKEGRDLAESLGSQFEEVSAITGEGVGRPCLFPCCQGTSKIEELNSNADGSLLGSIYDEDEAESAKSGGNFGPY
jgi:hypothetical protein